MQSKKRYIPHLALLIVMIVTVSSCDLFSFLGGAIEAALYSVDGQVVDSRSTSAAATGVEGVAVNLVAVSNNEEGITPEYTGTTDSTGAFSMIDMEPGTYILTGTLDGWFIPPTRVNISGLAIDLRPIPAFRLSPNDAYGLSFILTWNGNVADLDLHMNFPTSWADGQMDTPYDDYGTNDVEIYYSDKTYGAGAETTDFDYDVAYQDRDDTDGFGPETATLVQIPHADTTVTGTTTLDSANDVNGLYAAFGADAMSYVPFKWMGTTVLYVNAYTSGTYISSGQGSSSANAIVYAIQTLPKDPDTFSFSSLGSYNETDMTSSLLGVYRTPDNTKIKSSQILRINMFRDTDNVEWFQIVPDIRVIPEGPASNSDSNVATFLSAADEDSYVIGVKGRPITK